MADLSIEQLLQQHPELAQAFSQMSGVDPQQAAFDRQLQQAHALRMQSMARPAYGPWGGAGMGLANLLGGIHENQLESKNDALNQQRQQQMAEILRALSGQQGQQQPQQPPMPDAGP